MVDNLCFYSLYYLHYFFTKFTMDLTYQIIIKGTVQGVGFRPFVYNLAQKHDILGYVLNNSTGVEIKARGTRKALDEFQEALKNEAPPRSTIDSIEASQITNHQKSYSDFKIKFSESAENKNTQVSPELNVCRDCLDELFDRDNRRYLYPFINCTNCGPRFTITRDVPYDRIFTTMKKFEMCPLCSEEYNDPENRRFHAQPNSCYECGPTLSLLDNSGQIEARSFNPDDTEELFLNAAEYLRKGEILSIKSNGGFHLACDALNGDAVDKLRERKYRYDKALALMFPDMNSIKQACYCNEEEARLLRNYSRPIVLLKKKQDNKIAPSVAPGTNFLGVMLPYNPVQLLLFNFISRPLVMTSGNICGEPIIFQNDRAMEKLSSIATHHIIHNRNIHIRCDDSVYRIFQGENYPIRRSRGFVPSSININRNLTHQILACGAERKNTFAVAKENNIWLSQHIGDLENLAVLDSYETSIEHFLNIYDVNPEIVAHDLHPDYLSTKYAKNYDYEGVSNLAVQHHHAHAVSCMAENGLDEPVIGIILDGTGAGPDDTIWGGELMIAEHDRFERVGHLDHVRMPGGKSAIYNPWEMAVSYLFEIYGEDLKDLKIPSLARDGELDLVLQMLNSNVNTPVTSSCGRLFDAVSALAGVCSEINYEGQAAIELEQKIRDNDSAGYQMDLESRNGKHIIKWDKLIRSVVKDVQQDIGVERIALKFHNSLSRVLLEAALQIRKESQINKVVLSGGVFMNMYLLDRLVRQLEKQDFSVFWHNQVPANDGGLALGQVVIADAKAVK